ncbi:adenylate/guanylate cyclase domain-containing protein [Leptolyngbyaceae cyanobacterium CCMR0082]|uniref:Adenylate cyclase n=2 Tax=Adonisia turfae TaxID=2950184 RepID=A0A6M0SCB0_9CYAN|nr:adenylate cyclase [Adonisia turfae]MDV3348466.1 adenylate/guanylate cyclase domain-containing protein [Leptothoe sp. LEGE 181152]NEZ56494.1 adenylate/guanylate cyclase domain-containing protein [Adonisia turfae CCMR0081]NEZ65723.1 adenylate/guanylate cyclase domain-containing protein [Adonisia turfae CCMR0082]
MFGFSRIKPIHEFASYAHWRHQFMQRRLRLGILFGLFYFVTFLPLDTLTYVTEGHDPFVLLWIITNLIRMGLLFFCLWLIRKNIYRPRRIIGVFLLASWSISLLHRFHETYTGLASNTPIAEPDLFSWALSFITQATLVPVGWPLHLISQLGVIVYYFGVNTLLGLQVVTPGLPAASLLLNTFWICCICNCSVYFYEKLSRENFATNRELLEAQEKSERLLLNILPRTVAEKLKQGPDIIAESFSEVTVLFADIVNFTQLTETQPAANIVDLLNQVFSRFDQLAENHGLEKIKTIGDAYMVAAGLPQPQADHAAAVAAMAIEMQTALADFNAETGQDIALRIGIHTGPVVAGVIGLKKFAYDLWGDTVNTASRMESHGVPNGIQISEATYQRLQKLDERYEFHQRGPIVIKGKGPMITYLLEPCVTDVDIDPLMAQS